MSVGGEQVFFLDKYLKVVRTWQLFDKGIEGMNKYRMSEGLSVCVCVCVCVCVWVGGGQREELRLWDPNGHQQQSIRAEPTIAHFAQVFSQRGLDLQRQHENCHRAGAL